MSETSRGLWRSAVAAAVAVTAVTAPAVAQQQQRKPNILVIMGDDVGWFNIGAYHRGMMSGLVAARRQACACRRKRVPADFPRGRRTGPMQARCKATPCKVRL